MADPKIKFKRSAVAGKIPTAAQVPLGELALNTNDGLLYASKDVGAGVTVIAVNPFRVGTGTDSYNTFFTAGNVGINSTIPSSKLDVDGDVKLSGVITATTFSGSGASLTNLPAANLTGTLPAISGANLTNLPAANITGTLPAISIGGDLSIVDKIVHTGNTNTSIGFPSNNKVQFATSGSPRMTLDSSGRVLIGTTGAPAGTDAQYSRLVIRGNTQSATSVAYLSLGNGKTTSDTGTNENLGILTFNDNDNDAGEYARIIGASDGSNGTDDYPGKLIFSTTGDGDSAPTERMRITSGGDVLVGGGLSVTGNSFFVGVVTFAAGTDGNIVLGDAATDNVVFNADVNSNIVPNTNNAYDLGSSSQKWRNLFISGNANIGGTLTYEDVTNIDSVGLSTFRAGVNITGTATATLFSGSGASLTNLPAANLTGTLPAISGANLTNLDASDLASGTVPDGRFPATLPAISGANLTNLDATDLASGTIPDARFPAALPAIDGSALTGITASGTGAIGGLTVKNQSGAVVGTAGSVSTIDFDGSAGVTVTATTGAAGIATVLISADLVTDTSPQLGGNLDLNGNNITGSGNIPAANLTGTLPAISGANLTNLNGSNISSGTVAAARVGALPASKITTGTFADARIPDLAASKVTSGTFDAARIPTLNQDTTGTAALAEGLTGSPTIGVSTITTTGSVGIGSTLPTGKLDVIGQVNIKGSSTTTTSGIATSYTGSVYLDGNSDYLTVPGPGTLAASSNWTLECYFYCTGTSSGTYRIVGANESVNGSQYSFIRIRNGQYQFFTDNAYSSTVGTATFNAWHHIAFTKTGTTLRGFVDGVKIYEATDNNSDTITTLVIGWGYGSEYFPGYISNVRFVNGTSLYKENFTPQTAELTKIYNTTHLLAQSSSSATAEATGKTVTAVGTAAASTTNPSLIKGFDLSGSVEFDGNGDSISTSDNADFDFGTGDFTIELFANNSTSQSGNPILIGANGGWYIQFKTGGTVLEFYTGSTSITATGLNLEGAWHHLAVTKASNSIKIFVDGVAKTTVSNSNSINLANTLHIGNHGGSSLHYLGYISNVRIVKGTALYTSDFSPTYTELTNLPNTKLLALQSSSSATAYAVSPGAITANGNAAASSTSPGLISPNSITGSVEFDGTGDYLTVADSSLNPGTGDFAVEAFVKFASNSGTRRAVVMDTTAYGSNSLSIQQYNAGFEFYCGGQNHYTSGFDMTKWHHALITRKSNTIRYIVDGKIIGTDTSSNNIYGEPTNTLTIGGYNSLSNSEYMEGYISNVRLVVGSVPSEYETTSTSVGTQVFTPTREELTNITNTKFLGLQSASSATAYAVSPASISVNGDASASSTSPGLVKAYTNAGGQTTTTTTTPGNLLVSGITTATNRIDIKSDDSTPGRIDFYCESSNAHYTQLRSAAHSAYSGIATVTLPTSTGTLLLTDGSGASLTNLPAANLTGTLPAISGANLTNLDASDLASGTVPDARFPATLPAASGANLTNLPAANLTGTLPAISGVNLTNLDASDLASGTIPDARFPATLPAISGANLTNINATVAGISTTGTSTFNHLSVTGVATVSTAFYLPQYTTTARDAGTFNEGAMIYNTTVKKMEFYDGTNWNTLPGVTLGLGMGVF